MKKIAIVGSRDFPNLQLVKDLIYQLVKWDYEYEEFTGIVRWTKTLVSGHGGAVDLLVEQIANEKRIPKLIFPALWRGEDGKQPFNKGAAAVRNQLIIDNCDVLYAFYDGKGYKKSGTLMTVEMAAMAGIQFKIFTHYDKINNYTDLI